jgi:hypothetical protein
MSTIWLGRVVTYKLVRFLQNDYMSFVGVDSDDGATYLLSYFPKLERLVWSAHNDRVLSVDRGAIGKLFMTTCTSSRL